MLQFSSQFGGFSFCEGFALLLGGTATQSDGAASATTVIAARQNNIDCFSRTCIVGLLQILYREGDKVDAMQVLMSTLEGMGESILGGSVEGGGNAKLQLLEEIVEHVSVVVLFFCIVRFLVSFVFSSSFSSYALPLPSSLANLPS